MGPWARTACSFRSAQAATLLEFMYHSRIFLSVGGFCVVHDPKPPLHSHNWLSFGKFQDTESFLIHCERHFSSRLPPSGGTWKYAKVPSTKKTWRDSLHIDMLLSAVSVLVVAQSSSEIPEGLMNNPVLLALNKQVTCCVWKEGYEKQGTLNVRTNFFTNMYKKIMGGEKGL